MSTDTTADMERIKGITPEERREELERLAEQQDREEEQMKEEGIPLPVRIKKTRIRNTDYPNPSQQYQWAEWFRKGGIKARKGVHFNCGTSSFVQQARNAAKKKYRLSITEEVGVVMIKATPIK
jgi:hypothetical protein